MSVNATWYGNAAFHLRDDTGADVYLDPWLEGNPGCPIRVEDVASAAWVIVSHGDPGHYRDSVAIARRTGATYVAHHNLCDYIASAGLLPFTQLAGLSLGKVYRARGLSVMMIEVPHPPLDTTPDTLAPREPNCFTKLTLGGLVVGHAGDALFSETAFAPIIGGQPIDLLCLPMSGTFERAVLNAVLMMRALRPRWAIPACRYEREGRKAQALVTALDEDLARQVLLAEPGETVLITAPEKLDDR